MVFSSQTFLFVFLPVLVVLYALTPRKLKNSLLLVASLLFYVWGGGWFIAWLLASVMGNWVLGLLTHRARLAEHRSAMRGWVALTVVLNVGLLGWFKYANFLVDQVSWFVELFGRDPITWTPILLPIGISFFTFQASSYVFDLSKGEGEPLKNPLDFALFVCLFPQLIAGPIVRYRQIARELVDRDFTYENLCAGAVRFAHGLTKKVVIADSVAPIADAAFMPGADLTTTDAWIGAIAYTIQIYFDFSGYSDMAIGLGRMFGFTFPENFKHPYSSASMTEFWRRWHVTLSEWFRDYVYIPIGGSHGSKWLTYRNLIFVFLVTGFWHGANWTFVVWGAYHGLWLIIDRLQGRPERPTGWKLALKRAWVLLLVMIGWIVFRAESIGDALTYWSIFLFGNTGPVSVPIAKELTLQGMLGLVIGASSFVVPRRWIVGAAIDGLHEDVVDTRFVRFAPILRTVIVCVGLPIAIVLILGGTFSPFLYFQF